MAPIFTPLLILICFLGWSNAYKMVLFVPDITNSQVIFNSRIAETLVKAGHDVTMVLITGFADRDSSDVKIVKGVSGKSSDRLLTTICSIIIYFSLLSLQTEQAALRPCYDARRVRNRRVQTM
ncbi:hypothetical protein COOONC_21720 [Cooperia oncophora]